jgi:LSD1 subclass zinc finger protein
MQRTKTQQEVDQEQRDADFARQLHAQEQQQQQQRQQQYNAQVQQQQQQQRPQQPLSQVMCPSCTSINNVAPDKLNMQHMCGTCHVVLPNRQQQLNTARQADLPQTNYAPQQPKPQTLRCQTCHTDNVVPPGTTGAFMCGSCRTPLLAANAGPQGASQVPAPRPVEQPSGGQAAILQGVVSDPASVRVRCGRCSTVNVVPRDANNATGSVQFQCGSCSSVNQAPI